MENRKITAPQVMHSIDWLKHAKPTVFTEESYRLLDVLFEKLKAIAPVPGAHNDRKEFWLYADRGPIEDFGDYEGLKTDEMVRNYEEFEEWWKGEFPDEKEWFNFVAVEEEGYRVVCLGQKVIIHTYPQREIGFYDVTDIVQWLIDSVDDVVEQLKAGTYNQTVNAELPARHRTGTIRRADYWEIFPELKEEYFENISQEDVDEFLMLMESHDDKLYPEDRIQNMTANMFYGYCSMGYKANNYKDLEGKTPKEQYYRHADGRDEGLKDINADSSEAFYAWLTDKNRYGGHPWEVCRGGNSTHISLRVMHDEGGYWLSLDGSSHGRSIETAKFYLALIRAGLPVHLWEGKEIADRIKGEAKIGIVPQGVLPCYCDNWFPGETVLDFMNLDYDRPEEVAAKTVWQPILETKLK